jgi:hypothetical protein
MARRVILDTGVLIAIERGRLDVDTALGLGVQHRGGPGPSRPAGWAERAGDGDGQPGQGEQQ